MAEQIERKGAAFYRNVVKSLDDPKTRKVLLELADREEKHADAFAAIRKSLSERECPPTAFDPDNQDALYLQAMADEHVFNVKQDACSSLSGDESRQCILKNSRRVGKGILDIFLGPKGRRPKTTGQRQSRGHHKGKNETHRPVEPAAPDRG
jgi:Mn-containing catalase